jgi:4-amino-4-deoxy-L-arabinose transferase-like glycosyltransferase
MSAAKRKKVKHSKAKKSSNKISEVKRTDLTGDARRDIIFRYVLNGLLFIYLFYYLFQLYASLDHTFFWADENKHAYISTLVYKTHQLPTILPDDLYGDYRWSYPPLFHIFGATFMGIAGPSALKFFNLILLLIFLPSFFYLTRKHYGDDTAAVACLLVTLSPVLAINTIRFITEMLSMLCIFFSFFFLLLALKKSDKFYAIISGLFTGLLMLSKQAGFVVFGFYGLLLIWFFWRNKENFKILLWIIGVSVVTYSPYLVWALYNNVEVLGFVSAFLGLTQKPEWSAVALKSFHKYDSGIIEFANLFYKGHGFFISVSLVLPLYHFIRVRFKDAPENYIFFLLCFLSFVMMAWHIIFFLLCFLSFVMMAWHITNKRHTIILLPFIAFFAGYAVNQIATNKWIIRVFILLLLVIAGYLTYQMPDHRQRSNGPKEFIDMAQLIKEEDSSDARILSLRKFDTIMYTQKPVIWPHPKLNKIPIDLVEKQSAEKLLAVFKKYNIKYILIETPLIIKGDKFYAGRYPLYFVRACEQLERQGKIAFVAMTKSRRYILLKVV